MSSVFDEWWENLKAWGSSKDFARYGWIAGRVESLKEIRELKERNAELWAYVEDQGDVDHFARWSDLRGRVKKDI